MVTLSPVRSTPAVRSDPTPGSATYRVVSGDTLGAIARRFGTDVETLARLNGIRNPDRIFAGQTLTLPGGAPTHTVRRGDTLSGIAAANGTSVEALMRANPEIRNANMIYPGQAIRLGGAGDTTSRTPTAPTRTAPSDRSSPTEPLEPGQLNLDPRSIRAADIAQERAGSRSLGYCYRWVKQALQAAGAVDRYLAGGSAIQAGPHLEQQGYQNILNRPGFAIRSPYDAPVGAVLVYSGGQHGHIEFRTRNGFASDYASPNARTGAASNGISGRGATLVGVYVLPAAGGLRPPAEARVAPTPQPGPGSANDRIARLGSIITRGEGNYESYNSGTRGVAGGRVGHSFLNPGAGTVTNRTINEILATDSLSGTDPNRMFAVGKYQITIPTLRSAVSAMRLTGQERMTPDMQERIFREYLLHKAGGGALADFVLNGRGTVDQAQLAAAKEWASIGVPAGYLNTYGVRSDGYLSYYEKSGQNSANNGATTALRNFLSELARSR